MATIDSSYAVTPLTGRPGSSYSCFIRYSEYADGTDFTDTPTPETKYIGFYTGPLTTAPTDKASYTWSQYAGDEMLIKYGPSNVPYETSVDPLELDDDSLYELDDSENLTIGEYGEWHDEPLPGDRYVIISNDNGATWGEPMKIAADSLEVEYSPDGVQDWGTIFRASDKYMRQRIGEDAEWSAPIKIVGEDAIAAPVYECELSMSSIGSDVELTVYKDGEVCADTVYYEDFYGTGDSGATEEGPTGETTDGTATIEGGTDRNKHLVKIYSDENKTELLVTGFVSYGENGATGSDSTSYWLVEEAAAIKKSAAGVFTPSAINLSAKKKQGTQGVASYAGRLKVWKTEVANPSSNDWTQLYASATNESTMTTPITIQSSYKAIKCELYFEGGFTTLLDQDIIPIVDDGAKGDKGDNGTPLNNRGNWTANTAYAVLDCVYVASEKTSYFCKTAHTSGSTFSSTNWTILGAQGEQGETGAQGPQGNPGQNATQYYIHFVYNDSNTQADNYSKTEPRKYIGVYTDTNSADADTFAEATSRGAVWSQNEPDELMRKYSASSVPPDGLFELDDGDNLTLVDDTDSDLEIETGGEWHTERQEGDIYCIESTDGGRIWSDPLLLTEVVKESYEKYAVSDDGVTARFWRYDRPEVPAGSWLLVKKITVYEGGNSDEVVIPTYYPADALSLQTSADNLIYSLRRDGSANYQEFTVQAFVLIEDEKQPLTAYTADTSNASGITATVSYDSTNKIATFTLKTASGGTAPKGYVTISITTGGIVNTFTKQITISATKSGKYLGLATALTDTTATVNGSSVPASIGDFVTWGGTESATRKQTYNYQLVQTGASTVSWIEYTDDADTMTSLSDIMSLVDDATNKNTKAVLLVQRLVAAEEFLHKLFVNKIKLITEGSDVGAIYGGKYLPDGTVDPQAASTDKGVYMDAEGNLKSDYGEFNNISVNKGVFTEIQTVNLRSSLNITSNHGGNIFASVMNEKEGMSTSDSLDFHVELEQFQGRISWHMTIWDWTNNTKIAAKIDVNGLVYTAYGGEYGANLQTSSGSNKLTADFSVSVMSSNSNSVVVVLQLASDISKSTDEDLFYEIQKHTYITIQDLWKSKEIKGNSIEFYCRRGVYKTLAATAGGTERLPMPFISNRTIQESNNIFELQATPFGTSEGAICGLQVYQPYCTILLPIYYGNKNQSTSLSFGGFFCCIRGYMYLSVIS